MGDFGLGIYKPHGSSYKMSLSAHILGYGWTKHFDNGLACSMTRDINLNLKRIEKHKHKHTHTHTCIYI